MSRLTEASPAVRPRSARGDDPGAARAGVEVGAVEPHLEGRIGVAGGEFEQGTGGGAVEAEGAAGRAVAVVLQRGREGAFRIAFGAVELGVGDARQAPRAGLLVERHAKPAAVGGRVARQGIVGGEGVEAEAATAAATADLGGDRRADVIEDRAVERARQPRRLLRADERAEVARVGTGRVGIEPDVALRFVERGVAVDAQIDRGALAVADDQAGGVGLAGEIVAIGRGGRADFGRSRVEAAAQDDVEHALVGGIAIFQRDFLGQDFHPLDRLGGQVAQLAEARDPLAVEQQDRTPAVAAARAAGLRGDGLDQFGDRGGPGGADVAGVEDVFGRDVADHRTARTSAGDDDRLLAFLVKHVRIVGRRGRGLGGGGRGGLGGDRLGGGRLGGGRLGGGRVLGEGAGRAKQSGAGEQRKANSHRGFQTVLIEQGCGAGGRSVNLP